MKNLKIICAFSLCIGGSLLIFTNAVLTPLLNLEVPLSEMAADPVYLYRMVSAAATVFFLLLGTIAIQLHQGERSGAFGVFAFILTFAGCSFLFGNEWYQIFVIPELSQVDPEAITALENLGEFTKYDMGALVAFLAFVLGWILYAISMLTAGVYSRSAPLLMTAGFILTPLSTVILSPALGGAIGNAVVGFAFILIGWETLQRGHQAK